MDVCTLHVLHSTLYISVQNESNQVVLAFIQHVKEYDAMQL